VRTVFLGTSEFAATVLRRLGESRHRPVLVVTPPDRRKGRGRRTGPPPAAEAATELDIDLLQAEDVNAEAALERIRAARPEGVGVCAFGQLIREPLLSEWRMLNIHPSLLPRWRGAAPIERAIMAGDARTGVSVMRVTAGLDSGPVALREEVPIGLEDDFEATYAEKIDPAERRLDPARPAVELARTVRALTPHVGAYVETGGEERLGVRRARPVEVGVKQGALKAEWGALLLGCGRGALRLEVVQPPGGKPMPADAYLRGHRVPAL